jgi:hypothetical protein
MLVKNIVETASQETHWLNKISLPCSLSSCVTLQKHELLKKHVLRVR